jgi:hypothetical protein
VGEALAQGGARGLLVILEHCRVRAEEAGL